MQIVDNQIERVIGSISLNKRCIRIPLGMPRSVEKGFEAQTASRRFAPLFCVGCKPTACKSHVCSPFLPSDIPYGNKPCETMIYGNSLLALSKFDYHFLIIAFR